MSGMNCNQVRDLLPERRAGRLDDATEAAVAAHLDTCPGCRQEAELVDLVAGRVAAPSADLRARIVGAVLADQASRTSSGEAERATSRPHIRWLPFGALAVAAGVLLMLAGGFGLWQALHYSRVDVAAPVEAAAPIDGAAAIAAIDALPIEASPSAGGSSTTAEAAVTPLPEMPASNGVVAGMATLDGLTDAQLRSLIAEMGS